MTYYSPDQICASKERGVMNNYVRILSTLAVAAGMNALPAYGDDLSAAEQRIVAAVKAEIPGARTTVGCISWYRSKLKTKPARDAAAAAARTARGVTA